MDEMRKISDMLPVFTRDAAPCSLTETEQRQCREVLLLFEEYLSDKPNLCVAETKDYGYVVLADPSYGSFGYNSICESPENLFRELFRFFELDFLYQIGMINGCEDFESSRAGMTGQQAKLWNEKRDFYYSRFCDIMSLDRKDDCPE